MESKVRPAFLASSMWGGLDSQSVQTNKRKPDASMPSESREGESKCALAKASAPDRSRHTRSPYISVLD